MQVYHSPKGKMYNSYAASKPHFVGPLVPQPTASAPRGPPAVAATRKSTMASAAPVRPPQKASVRLQRQVEDKWSVPIAVSSPSSRSVTPQLPGIESENIAAENVSVKPQCQTPLSEHSYPRPCADAGRARTA